MLSRAAKYLLWTIAYSQQFEFPLTVRELYMRIPLIRGRGSVSLTSNELGQEIFSLVDKQYVGLKKKDNSTFIFITSHSESVNIRQQRQHFSERKLQQIKPLITFCSFIPWIRGVAITGSVSVMNAKEADDTDLMIVCSDNRLWLVRPLVLMFAQMCGKRRTWRGEEPNSWCFNLWMEESHMTIDRKGRSQYTAYEVLQAMWLLCRGGCEHHFLLSNMWVQALIPRLAKYRMRQVKNELQLVAFSARFAIFSWILDALNWLSYSAQFAYMKPHMTRERVSLHLAAFHPRDTSKSIHTKIMNYLIFLF